MEKNVITKGANVLDWNLDSSGRLTVRGAGKIPDYVGKEKFLVPWDDCKDKIYEIIIDEGITEIGVNAFRDCTNLKSVILPESLWRIHAYAFWNCINLVKIETKREDFLYYYDQRNDLTSKQIKGNKVIFGEGAFHKVPWCIEKWGDFYSWEGVLYICFTDKKDIQIPEGIQILKKYSFSHVEAEALSFPDTLELIENFAFYRVSVEKEIFVKIEQKNLKTEPYAFADVAKLSLSIPWKMKELGLKRTNAEILRRNYFAEYIAKHTLSLKKVEGITECRKLNVIEQHMIFHKNGDVTKVKDSNYIDVGRKLLRKIKNGKLLICITCEKERVRSVKSFNYSKHYGLPVEYLMYPVILEDKSAEIWSDSFTYMEDEDILCAFPDTYGPTLKKKGILRRLPEGRREEWFEYEKGTEQGGGVEIELLNEWLKFHPEYLVDDTEENIENKKYRMFVDV